MATHIVVDVKSGPGIGEHLDGGLGNSPLSDGAARTIYLQSDRIRGIQDIGDMAEFDASRQAETGSEILYDGGNVTMDRYWVSDTPAELIALIAAA